MELLNRAFYKTSVWMRTGILWVVFMAVTWSVAITAYLTHPQAWLKVYIVQPERGWDIFLFILGNNAFLMALIVVGNLFVRFGPVTPGLIILLWQAISIGWTAGTNGFMEPFPSFVAANRAFLFVGLWETSAYVLICAATLPKSLLVSNTFPAKAWSERHELKDLNFTRSEKVVTTISIMFLVGAAFVEAFLVL